MEEREDLLIEYAALCNMTGQHRKALDLILSQKRMTAKRKGITTELHVTPLSGLPFEERDPESVSADGGNYQMPEPLM